MNRAFSPESFRGCLRLRLNSASLALNTPEVSLLHGHKCADWNFGEEFARRICRQPDATVGCRIVRDITSVNSKMKTAQTHEIRHVDVGNSGTMVTFLISD